MRHDKKQEKYSNNYSRPLNFHRFSASFRAICFRRRADIWEPAFPAHSAAGNGGWRLAPLIRRLMRVLNRQWHSLPEQTAFASAGRFSPYL